LFVFAFLALFGKLQNRWVLYGALAFVFTKQGWGCGLSFLSGVALCDLLGGRLPARSLPVTGAVLALAGLFLGGMTPDWVRAVGGERLPGRLLAIHMTAGAVLLLGGIAHAAWLRTVLYARPLIFLGRVSFSLYLVHLLVEFSLGCRTYLACRSAGLDHLSGFLITGVTTTVVSLLLAWVGALTVEPFSIWVGKTIFLRVFKTRRVPEDSKRLPGPSQGQNESSESSSDRGIATALRA
jgi:peptidoglycan/LPS O-acetylase OafA/YrhL